MMPSTLHTLVVAAAAAVSLLPALAAGAGEIKCGKGTLLDEATSTCIVDPALLVGPGAALDEPGAAMYVDRSVLHIDAPPGGKVLVDNVEVASCVAKVAELEAKMEARVTALAAKVGALEADVRSTTTSTTTTTTTTSTLTTTTTTATTTTATTTTATTTTITTTITTTTILIGSGESSAAASCKAIKDAHAGSKNGAYWIKKTGNGNSGGSYQAYCDMAGGGWTYANSKKTPFRIPFTGAVHALTTPEVKTKFMFTLYGAAAGSPWRSEPDPSRGGYGGVAKGAKEFEQSTKLFVYVGGKGGEGHREDQDPVQRGNNPKDFNYGGWNGGGRATRGGSGGGGGTDIRTKAGDLNSRVVVAGGGGGCGYNGCERRGGDGGGLTGENGAAGEAAATAYGGSQTAGGKNKSNPNRGYSEAPQAFGKFGVGGDFWTPSFDNKNGAGGGGGGWWGGSGGSYANTPGGGGSSYIAKMEQGSSTEKGVNKGHGYVDYIFM